MGPSEQQVFSDLGSKNLGIQGLALGSIPKSINQVAAELGYNPAAAGKLPQAPLFPGKAAKPIAGDTPSDGNAGGGPLSEAERTQLQSLLARLIGTK
jgi:hypothetical protein